MPSILLPPPQPVYPTGRMTEGFIFQGRLLNGSEFPELGGSEFAELTVRGETVIKTHGISLGALGAVEVCVSPADQKRAKELLKAAEAGEFRLDEGNGE